MDELEVRRQLLADPYHLTAQLQQALRQDAELRQFHQSVLEQDELVRNALHRTVPLKVQQQLQLLPVTLSQPQRKNYSRGWLALAASLAFLVGLGLNWATLWYGPQNLGANSLAHVYHEEPYVKHLTQALSLQDVNIKLADFNAQMQPQGWAVLYANYCHFRGMRSLHLVLQTELGPLTVFVVPKDSKMQFEPEFDDGRYFGRGMMLDDALVVLVAEGERRLQQQQRQLLQQLVFRT
ncbi:DUF3379 family protein [Rheinheimera sp.]|uniref:DUF3379 family protein n=1 Tax=Rheinheimera sp. TaxID=1869214 RepID=UPI00307E4D25